MQKRDIELLIKNGVSIDFEVHPAHLARGFNVLCRVHGDLEPVYFKTARGDMKLFRNLDTVFSSITLEFGKPFMVRPL